MPRRRPSGSKALRFVDFEGQQIPVYKDEGTEFYFADPKAPIAIFTGDGGWATEGTTFWLHRGDGISPFEIDLVELRVDFHPGMGEYGQLRRFVGISEIDADKFFDWPSKPIPESHNECTEIYEELDDGTISEKPLTRLLSDGTWAKDGALIIGNRSGEKCLFMVILIELELFPKPEKGGWSQLSRRLLVKPLQTLEQTLSLSTRRSKDIGILEDQS